MEQETKSFSKALVGALATSAFVSFGANAADETNTLRAEVQALKMEIQELRGLIKGGREESASKGEVSALKKEIQVVKETSAKATPGKAVTLGGVEVTTNGDLQQWFVYSGNPKFSDVGAVASNKGNFSFYANPSTLAGLGYSSQNYNDIKGKTDKGVRDAEASAYTRYRQWFTASSADQKIKGVWAVEIGGGKWGNQSDSLGKSKGFGYSGDGVNVETRWLYTDFEAPGIGGRATAGLQTVPLGKDFGEFLWSETATGLTYSKTTALGDIGVGWLRGRTPTNKNAGFSAGNFDDDFGYLTFGNGSGNERMAFVFAASRRSNWSTNSGGYLFDDKALYIGGTGKFAAGALSGDVTALYQGGSITLINTPIPQKLDRRAYLANGNLKWTPSAEHKATFAFLYASGDGRAADKSINNYQAVDVDFSHGLILFEGPASEVYTTDAPYFLDKGLKMPSVRYDYQPSKGLVLSGLYSYISTDKKTQRIGAAAVNPALGKDGQTYGTLLGYELDFFARYNIWKGFDALSGVGYLWAGNGLDAYTNDGAQKAKNIFKTQLELRYRF